MREITFKMERPGLVSAGDTVKISEKKTALNYSYIIEPAVAMSGCYKVNQRLKAREGTVKEENIQNVVFMSLLHLRRNKQCWKKESRESLKV